MNILKRFLSWLYSERFNGQNFFNGLLKDLEDTRDFKTHILGWGTYVPKNQYVLVPSKSVKNQGSLSTCQWNASTSQWEDETNKVLSVECLVAEGRSQGLAGENGISDLRSGQKVLQSVGICEDELLPNPDISNYSSYSNPKILVSKIISAAAQNKSKTYWLVTSKDDTLKLLDEGTSMTTGMMWYSGFNMGFGFSYPWLITKNVGNQVMGHAFKLKGYVKGYLGISSDKKLVMGPTGTDVYVFQNSYGENWGAAVVDDKGITHKGLFFVAMNFFDSVGYSKYANLPIHYDLASFYNTYSNLNVKGDGPAIYFIDGTVKRAYPDWTTFLAYNGKQQGYEKVDELVLNQVMVGPDMDITKSQYYPMIKDLAAPANLNKLLELIHSK